MEHLRRPLDTMAVKLLHAARTMKEPNDNVILCPFSITTAATMLYYGSDGNAFNELERVLQYDQLFEQRANPKDVLMAFREAIITLHEGNKHSQPGHPSQSNKFHVVFGNQLFLQTGAKVKHEFLERIQKNLKISSQFMDFSDPDTAMEQMHSTWVKHDLGKRFDTSLPCNLIDPGVSGSRMVIANAAHCRGGWQVPFDYNLTTMGTFYLDNGATKEVQMMHITDKFPYVEDFELGVKYIEIPYYNNVASLILTLSTKTDGFQAFLKRLGMSSSKLEELNMKKRMKNVVLSLPRFAVQWTYDLKALLKHVGIKHIFQEDAGVSNMSDERISCEGFHKTAIEVNENGTFAVDQTPEMPDRTRVDPTARVTPGKLKFGQRLTNAKVKPEEHQGEQFIADQPFLVAVRHNQSMALILCGCVMNP